ncbi:MAG: hypothetical protein HRT37_11190 [Alteromonadaceae bacterium]|nr:hypothetical protein [Alteromonadaceae bacterium]
MENANSAVDALSEALEKVSLERATYGAMQNRLGFSINHMTNMMINTESARSRIMDADFAAETANLAKNQLLLQASSAMLGKFNRIQSETILSLINSIK